MSAYKQVYFRMTVDKSAREKTGKAYPPHRSKNIFTDIRYFLLSKPRIDTLVRIQSLDERENFNMRILQRTGLGTHNYKMLNIHKIGVEVPAS